MTEQRKSKRFELRLPLELVRSGSQTVCRNGETRNLSSCGVLFTSDGPIEVGEPIEYMITLPTNPNAAGEVRLRCVGKVLRLDDPATFAATLERYEFVRSRG